MKTGIIVSVLAVALFAAVLIGEVKCIIKAVKCNWDPIGKAELVYTIGACTGAGCIIGYIDIEDK